MSKVHVIKKAERMPRSMSYQASYLEDESDNILVEKGRQEGFSEYTALKAVRACVKKGALYDWWICSRDKTAAKLFVDDCKKWAEIYNLGAVELGEEIIEDETVFSITFPQAGPFLPCPATRMYWQASVVVWYWMNMRFINSSRNC